VAIDDWSRNLQLSAKVAPHSHLPLVLSHDHLFKPQMILFSVGECIINIAEFDILHLSVLFWQNENVAAGLWQV